MKLYSIYAVRASDEVIDHHRLSMTKAVPLIRELGGKGYTVTLTHTGEKKHEPPPPKRQPKTHPWKAKPAVHPFYRKKKGKA